MRVSDFSARAPGRLRAIGRGVHAFVPAPLPPRLSLPNELLGLLSEASLLLGRLGTPWATPIDPLLVAAPLQRREAIVSSRIEGTYTTPAQLALFDTAGEPTPAGAAIDEATREVLNHVRAFSHGLARLARTPIHLRLMREMHGKLLEGVRGGRERPGEFRKEQNFIGRDAEIANARFVPPPPDALDPLLNDLERYINVDRDRRRVAGDEPLPLLVRIALVQYQFEAIHPFRDGNGRIGRLLIPLQLHAAKVLDTPVFFMSSFFELEKRRYAELLLAVSQRAAWIEWVRFFLEGIVASAKDSLERCSALVRLHADFSGRIRQKRKSARAQDLVDSLFRRPSIAIKDAARILQMTPAAATQHVRDLVDKGILRPMDDRKWGRVYVAPEILQLIDPDPALRAASSRRGH